MRLLVILNQRPYNGTDVTWNALRLIEQAQKKEMTVKVFLMNDAVDLAREGLEKSVEYDLQEMLLGLISNGIEVKLCKTCINRYGLSDSKIRHGIAIATMPELVEWIEESDRVISF